MKIHFLIYPVMACMLMACGNKEDKVQPVMASRTADSVKAEWSKPHEAILRVRVDSEHPTDLLSGLDILCDQQAIASSRADQLMTHPFQRDYVVEPTQTQSELTFTLSVNDTMLQARTIVPCMATDTRTQINLNLANGHLRLLSSWVEDYTGGAEEVLDSSDTICVGHFLNFDGTLTARYQDNSVAVVVAIDGRHGKAAALRDTDGEWIFSSKAASMGKYFDTLEGKTREGLLHLGRTEGDSLSRLFYCATLPYPKEYAFSHTDGYSQSHALYIAQGRWEMADNDMLNFMAYRDGSYIPTIADMAALYDLIYGMGGSGFYCEQLQVPNGAYLTCTESSSDLCYSMDFRRGGITGYTSKRFTPLRLRLFYIF